MLFLSISSILETQLEVKVLELSLPHNLNICRHKLSSQSYSYQFKHIYICSFAFLSLPESPKLPYRHHLFHQYLCYNSRSHKIIFFTYNFFNLLWNSKNFQINLDIKAFNKSAKAFRLEIRTKNSFLHTLFSK